MDTLKKNLIDWGVATRALAGQTASGDKYLVKTNSKEALVAVVDGLGHGEAAAVAADTAIASLDQCRDDSPLTMVEQCHEQLRSTRGVVLSLAKFCADDNTVTWLGVGNVEGVLLHQNLQNSPSQQPLLLRSGVVGDQLPRLSVSTFPICRGDVLVLATDGVRSGFADYASRSDPPSQMAAKILDAYGQDSDDALVLVVRYNHG